MTRTAWRVHFPRSDVHSLDEPDWCAAAAEADRMLFAAQLRQAVVWWMLEQIPNHARNDECVEWGGAKNTTQVTMRLVIKWMQARNMDMNYDVFAECVCLWVEDSDTVLREIAENTFGEYTGEIQGAALKRISSL